MSFSVLPVECVGAPEESLFCYANLSKPFSNHRVESMITEKRTAH